MKAILPYSLLLASVGLAACHDSAKPDPAPAPTLPGTWNLQQEYRRLFYYNPDGSLRSRYDYSRAGNASEGMNIGDSTWVFQPADVYMGSKDGVYKLKDTTIVVKLNRPSGFNFPITETYTFSALDEHRVVIRQKDDWRDQVHYYKWIYTR
ncbi:hypothetical protein [Hymenobacter pini]|uniref:hypothetical protein n=1 Tax=Hymenobacter pini TaxID=2880879 RepID=UPI001CF474AC|nr:hypothetical protein [Hymenobacter pini]MCA8833397.1 hypothetical protein [Hymenobacter pini]